ncbi:MAG: histidine phosphatase family protein [Pseudomonadota bacterium]
MSARQVIFLTHAEVAIDPDQPVPHWRLSDVGQARHAAFAHDDRISNVTAIYTSTERKAKDGAAPVAAAKGLSAQALTALGENDRSATGYLPKHLFEATADRFFAFPDDSIDGWERARAAQARVVAAMHTVVELDRTKGDILIVAHGGVGALLRCHLLNRDISRDQDQPAGGGYFFMCDRSLAVPPSEWVRI